MKKVIGVVAALSVMGWVVWAQPSDPKNEVIAALEALHEAEETGDIAAYDAIWGEDAVFLGTDASEAWPKEEFMRDIGERWKTGGTWTFEILERTVGVEGNAAWFKEVVRYNEGGGFILRPTGTFINRDGVWKLVQLHMGVPVPNDVYGAAVQGFMAHEKGADAEKAKASKVLDALHDLASKADWNNYFALFTPDATFLGTDKTEVWSIDEFKGYAEGAPNGWTYHMTDRNLHMMPGHNAIYFNELVEHERYGILRGTGVLARVRGEWKIAQYNLTWPIPNEIALDMATQILDWQKKQDAKKE